MTKPAYTVYECYDADGNLLYVGVTGNYKIGRAHV